MIKISGLSYGTQGNHHYEKGLYNLVAYCVIGDRDILAILLNVWAIALVNDHERHPGKCFKCKNVACMLSYIPERYLKGAFSLTVRAFIDCDRTVSQTTAFKTLEETKAQN